MTQQKEDNLEICKRTRIFASDTLYTVLKEVLDSKEKISEAAFRDRWLAEMQKNKNIFPEGWYSPPPFGIAVIFGGIGEDFRRDYKSLRPPESWPREDILFDENHPHVYAYASPVDRATGIIGDFAGAFYLGKDEEIRRLHKLSLQLDKEIFDFVERDMTFAEIFQFAEKKMKEYGLINNDQRITDPTTINIGHTIPFLDRDVIKKHISWDDVKNLISKNRTFLNAKETMKVKSNMAFTIEPRTVLKKNVTIPIGKYHTIALFHEDGTKELLTNFNNLFTLTGMDYMIQQ